MLSPGKQWPTTLMEGMVTSHQCRPPPPPQYHGEGKDHQARLSPILPRPNLPIAASLNTCVSGVTYQPLGSVLSTPTFAASPPPQGPGHPPPNVDSASLDHLRTATTCFTAHPFHSTSNSPLSDYAKPSRRNQEDQMPDSTPPRQSSPSSGPTKVSASLFAFYHSCTL